MHSLRDWRFLAGVAASLVCLALVVNGVRWVEVWTILTQAQPVGVVAAGVLVVALLAARTARWSILLMALRSKGGRSSLLAAVSIGYFLNNILPARMGDLARAYFWGEWAGVSKVAVLSTVAVERLVDALFAVLTLLILLAFIPLPDWVIWTGFSAGLIGSSLIVFSAVVVGHQSRLLRSAAWVQRRLPLPFAVRLESYVSSLLEGLAVLRDFRKLRGVVFWSLVIWIGQAAYAYAIMRSIGLQTPSIAIVAVIAFTSLSMAAPSAPGNVGVYHYAVVLALGLFGVGREPALGYGLLLHGLSYIVVSLLGIFFTWQRGISWSRLKRLPLSVDD